MNGLEEIQKKTKKFIYEKEKMQQQISKIEEKRTELAQQRNEKKKFNCNWSEINELGKQITELGNQSQELQNQLDFKSHTMKSQTNLLIDNLIAEGIRKIRLANEESSRIQELIKNAEKEIEELSKAKENMKNGNWRLIVEPKVEPEELRIEEIKVEEMPEIGEIAVEEFKEVEELYVEEFQPIEEIQIEEFSEFEEIQIEEFKGEERFLNSQIINENEPLDEIEKLARQIVEEIAQEQTKDIIINNEIEQQPEDLIKFEENEEEKSSSSNSKVIISNIIIKIEENELLYKAQMSNDEEVKIYLSSLGKDSVLLRDKQNREECKKILINYVNNQHKIFNEKVIKKIDPLVCELLIECAKKYGYNAQELVYNYAMSFTQYKANVPQIIYNISLIEKSNLSNQEKAIIRKIARKARQNNQIDIIESIPVFKRIKYILKRLFIVNNVKALPEAKY